MAHIGIKLGPKGPQYQSRPKGLSWLEPGDLWFLPVLFVELRGLTMILEFSGLWYWCLPWSLHTTIIEVFFVGPVMV